MFSPGPPPPDAHLGLDTVGGPALRNASGALRVRTAIEGSSPEMYDDSRTYAHAWEEEPPLAMQADRIENSLDAVPEPKKLNLASWLAARRLFTIISVQVLHALRDSRPAEDAPNAALAEARAEHRAKSKTRSGKPMRGEGAGNRLQQQYLHRRLQDHLLALPPLTPEPGRRRAPPQDAVLEAFEETTVPEEAGAHGRGTRNKAGSALEEAQLPAARIGVGVPAAPTRAVFSGPKPPATQGMKKAAPMQAAPVQAAPARWTEAIAPRTDQRHAFSL